MRPVAGFPEALAALGAARKSVRVDPATAPKESEILDLLDQIAVVKLSAAWGIDYLNLAKEDGRWKIIKVLWQTYPTAGPR